MTTLLCLWLISIPICWVIGKYGYWRYLEDYILPIPVFWVFLPIPLFNILIIGVCLIVTIYVEME